MTYFLSIIFYLHPKLLEIRRRFCHDQGSPTGISSIIVPKPTFGFRQLIQEPFHQPANSQVLTLFCCPHTYVPMVSLSCVSGKRLFHVLKSFIDGFTAWLSIPFSTISVQSSSSSSNKLSSSSLSSSNNSISLSLFS